MDKGENIIVQSTFEKISWLREVKNVLVTIDKYNIEKHDGVLRKCERGFELIVKDLFQGFYVPFEMKLEVGDQTYYCNNYTMTSREFRASRKNLTEPLKGGMIVSGDIWLLCSEVHKNLEHMFRRFVICVGKSNRLQFYVETEEFKDEKMHHFYGKAPVTVMGLDFNIYEVSQDDERHFFIDSTVKIPYEEFSDICHSIMIGYGLLCATFYQNEAFYLSSEEASFSSMRDIQYLQLRNTLKGLNNPIYGEPYGRTDDESLADRVKDDMKPLSQELFSKLCNRIYSDKNYASLIILLLEANTASLILQPAGYSVALERLTNIIADENDGLKPIKDKALAKKFRTDLVAVLEGYKDAINATGDNDAMVILQKNIDKINNPTNRDKLIKPFAMYGIELNDLDLVAIDNRNNFLHGRNGNDEEGNKIDELKVYHISLRLNVLVNKLLLKHLGYNGRIINYVKYYEDQLRCEINEELFVKI